MFRCRRSVVVDAPVDRVFGYLARWQSLPQWCYEDVKVLNATSRPLTVNRTFTTGTTRLGLEGEYTQTAKGKVTEYIPDKRLAWEKTRWGCTERHSVELRPSNGGTLITLGAHRRYSRWWLPVLPLVCVMWPVHDWHFIHSREGRKLRRLKKRLESGAQPKTVSRGARNVAMHRVLYYALWPLDVLFAPFRDRADDR